MTCTIISQSDINLNSVGTVFFIPFASCKVAAGFPSPADDHLDSALNLNDLLVKRPAATFLVRATGKSMQGSAILNNDILVVDRSVDPKNGKTVIAAINGECLVKIYRCDKTKTWLQSSNKDFPDIILLEDMNVEIWGVVTGVVRTLVS